MPSAASASHCQTCGRRAVGPAAGSPPEIQVVRVNRWSENRPLGQVDGTTSWKAPEGKKTMVSCSGSIVR